MSEQYQYCCHSQIDCRGLIAWRIADNTFYNVTGHTHDLSPELRLPSAMKRAVDFRLRAIVPGTILQNCGEMPRLLYQRLAEEYFGLYLSGENVAMHRHGSFFRNFTGPCAKGIFEGKFILFGFSAAFGDPLLQIDANDPRIMSSNDCSLNSAVSLTRFSSSVSPIRNGYSPVSGNKERRASNMEIASDPVILVVVNVIYVFTVERIHVSPGFGAGVI